jgi:hypothetical protein
LLAGLFSAAGCVMIDPSTSMNRTHVTKDGSGKVTTTVEPITTHSDRPAYDYHPDAGGGHGHHANGPSIGVLTEPMEAAALYALLEEDPEHGVPLGNSAVGNSQGGNLPAQPVIETSYSACVQTPSAVDGPQCVGVEFRAVRSSIMHAFTTGFHSPDLTSLDWHMYPDAYGAGGEVSLLFDAEEFIGMIGIGFAGSEITTNSHQESSFYVKETTTTDMGWVYGGGKFKPLSWVYAEGLYGLFFYSLSTDVESNTTTYTYDGLSGHGGFDAIGIGGGLETPGDTIFHLFIGGRLWLALSDEDAYEFGVLQLNGGIACRF